jgi:hypothetical protein
LPDALTQHKKLKETPMRKQFRNIVRHFVSAEPRIAMALSCGVLLLASVAPAIAQNNGAPQPSARQQLEHIHSTQSIDQELARLTKDLGLSPDQQKQVRMVLQEHHDKIQALLDKNPKASRQQLAPQVHAISDETHREIHALLTEQQRELEKAMQQREHNGEENRRPAPSGAH